MGDSSKFHSCKSLETRVITSKKLSKSCLVALPPKGFSQKTSRCITSVKQGMMGSGAAGDIGLFLLKTAALEVVRRFSRAKCPFVWCGLQALQLFCYPPLKWIQRWAPFKGLVKHMQTLSRPLLVLTIATGFSDPAYSESQSERSSQLPALDTRSVGKVPKSLTSEKWLVELRKELENEGIALPERLDEDELCRFYAAANAKFSRLLFSVKKTIHWRQTYTMLSPQELEAWSHLVFWHGCDVKQRPCLIIRLGLACSNLRFNNRSLFVKAIVSQIEHGVMNLVDVEHPQITVLMDCEGLSPFGFPMQMMRSCAILLQDNYPNRLSCLIVIRLPPVARVITRTLFQVLKPATRQKLRIIGENYLEFLSENLQTLPAFLCGKFACSKSSDVGNIQGMNEEIIQLRPRLDLLNDMNAPSPDLYYHTDASMNGIKTAMIGVLVLWIFIALILGMHYPENLPQFYRHGGL